MESPASIALRGIGVASIRVERRLRSRLSIYPTVMKLDRLPSGSKASSPLKMLTQKGRDQVVRRLYGGGWNYEAPQPLLIENALRVWRAGSVLDVGANTGAYSILAAATCNNRPIFAFEPMPDVYQMMVDNFSLNECCKGVKVFMMAASSQSSSQTLFVPNRLNNAVHCSSTLSPGVLKDTISQSLTVKTVMVDDIVQEAVSVMKIDVEGFEESVLQGASNTIMRYRPIIFCEILTIHKGLGSIPCLMEKFHYVRASITKNAISLVNQHDCDPALWDYVLVHRNDIDLLKDLAERSGIEFFYRLESRT